MKYTEYKLLNARLKLKQFYYKSALKFIGYVISILLLGIGIYYQEYYIIYASLLNILIINQV